MRPLPDASSPPVRRLWLVLLLVLLLVLRLRRLWSWLLLLLLLPVLILGFILLRLLLGLLLNRRSRTSLRMRPCLWLLRRVRWFGRARRLWFRPSLRKCWTRGLRTLLIRICSLWRSLRLSRSLRMSHCRCRRWLRLSRHRLLAIDGDFRPIRRLHTVLLRLLLADIALRARRCYRANHCRTSYELILPLSKRRCRLRGHVLRDDLAVDNGGRRSHCCRLAGPDDA